METFDPNVARDEGEEKRVHGMGITTWPLIAEDDEWRLEVFIPIEGVFGAEMERKDIRSTSPGFRDTICRKEVRQIVGVGKVEWVVFEMADEQVQKASFVRVLPFD